MSAVFQGSEGNQRAAAECRVTYHDISIQCSDWDMKDTATAGLSAKGFRVMYPGEGNYGTVVTVNKTAEELTLIRKGLYFFSTPGPDTRPGYKTKVTVTVHDLNGKKLAEYQGESSPGESYHRSEAVRSACRKAISRMPVSSSVYW